MDELKVVTLEGKEYTILDEIRYESVTYIYFVNPNNIVDFCIRKLIDEKQEVLFQQKRPRKVLFPQIPKRRIFLHCL